MSDQEQDNENHPFHREGDALILDTPSDPEEARRKARENEQHEFQRAQVKANKRIALFTGILVFATFCTIGVGIWQNSISQESANAAKRAADATRQAAYTACVSSKIARSTLLEIQSGESDSHNIAVGTLTQAAAVIWAEAAQIKITQSTSKTIISPGSVISIPWNVENIGKSAAHNLKIVSVIKLVESGSEPDFTYPRQPMNQNKIGNLFPNDPKPMLVFTTKPGPSPDSNIPVALTPQEYWRYEAGQIYISDYGRGTYTDIFGKSHWIQFCDHISYNLFTEQLTRHQKCGAYNNSDSQPLEGKSAPPSGEKTPDEIVCIEPKDQ